MNWSYLFKHCFGTLLLGPLFSEIILIIYDVKPNNLFGLLELYPLSLLFSLIFSAPTYIIYALVYYCLAKFKIQVIYSKIILISLVVFGIIITTSLLKGSIMQDVLISYTIAAILLGFILNLNFKRNDNHSSYN